MARRGEAGYGVLRPLEATPCLAAKGPTTTRARMAWRPRDERAEHGSRLTRPSDKIQKKGYERCAWHAARDALRRCGAARPALHRRHTLFYVCAAPVRRYLRHFGGRLQAPVVVGEKHKDRSTPPLLMKQHLC